MMKSVVDNCLRVLLHCLSCNQSIEVLQSMFATQRCIVKKVFPLVLDYKMFLYLKTGLFMILFFIVILVIIFITVIFDIVLLLLLSLFLLLLFLF